MQLQHRVKAIRGWVGSGYLLVLANIFAIACALPGEKGDVFAADAEAFEAIVRSQMSDSANSGFLRVDSRPAGDKDILSGPPPTASGLDPDSSADPVPESDTRTISDQRKDILRNLHVEEGGPFVYPE